MKLLSKIAFLFLMTSKFVFADLLADSNTIFDWGEVNYPQFMAPANQPTQFIEGWRFRYYPETKNYVGVNDEGEVFLLGVATNDQITSVGTVISLLAIINSDIHQLLKVGDTSQCKNVPLVGTIGKIAKLEVTDGDFKGFQGTLELTKQDSNIIKVVGVVPLLGAINLNGTYEDKELGGEPFRIFKLENELFPLNVPLPVRWCKGMQWKSDLSANEVNPAVNTYTIVALDETLELLDGSTRSAVKLSALIVEPDKEPATSFAWIDIETGYPLKVNTKQFGALTAIEIKDTDKK